MAPRKKQTEQPAAAPPDDVVNEQITETGAESGTEEGTEVNTPAPLPKGMGPAAPEVAPPVVMLQHDRLIPEIGLTTRQVFDALRQPFEPELLYYKPQVVSKDKKTCQVAVYADPRAYIDRLNEVVGPENWSTTYETLIVPFKGEKGWGENRKTVEGHKLLVYCHLTITGMGSHVEVGEAETDNDNAATVAQAMAFKRACVTYGLGRYLYDFPKGQWADYDERKRKVTNPPPLPDFAVPVYICADCKSAIGWSRGRDPQNPDQVIDIPPRDVKDKTVAKFGVPLCGPCVKTRVNAQTTPQAAERLQ